MTTTMTETTPKRITKKQQAINEREEACARLRELIQPGGTVYCIVKHVSSSGMSRISFAVAQGDSVLNIDWLICRALDYRQHDRGGVIVSGCGMDMGFHIVYNLGRVIFRDGFGCIGREARCPSNDHANGDRDYTPGHKHSDPGYALRHSWL
jgi:hypothetical protein